MRFKLLSLLMVSLVGCASPVAPPELEIKGFGAVKLGQTLPEVRAALEKDNLFYTYTGRTVDYQADANGDRWHVSAMLIKLRVSSITLTARPFVMGMPLVSFPKAECDHRWDKSRDALQRQYGSETREALPDDPEAEQFKWSAKNRAITLYRHKSEGGCDSLTITYADYSIADHL